MKAKKRKRLKQKVKNTGQPKTISVGEVATSSWLKYEVLLLLFMSLVAFLLYSSSLQGPFLYDDNPNIKDKSGKTAFIWSCVEGFSDIAQILIDNNANVNKILLNEKIRGIFSRENPHTFKEIHEIIDSHVNQYYSFEEK